MLVKDVGAAWSLEKVSIKSAQTVPNIVEIHLKAIRHGCCKHGILHIMHGLAFHSGGN